MKQIFKQIYNYIPFKKYFFIFLKMVYTPSERVYKHLHFKGFFKIKMKNDFTFKMYHAGYVEENEIFWNGIYNGWEKKSISLWIDLSKNANTIIDIGANTGLYSLVAKTINPTSNIFAFEPIEGVFSILEKNVRINKYNINCQKIALSNYNGIGKIYLPKGKKFAYSVTVNKNTLLNKEISEIEINVQKLETSIELLSIKNIDLIKLDVETHEVEVIEGMGNYLSKYKPAILIEILNDEIADKLNNIFKDLGYLYFNIDDKKNTVRRVEKITKSDYWNFLLCDENTARKINLI